MPVFPRTRVIVTHRQVGFHAWPNAPADVAYLAQQHRHLFTFRVECAVVDGDREIEFHTLQRAVRLALGDGEYQWGARSCEHIAIVLRTLLSQFPVLAIEVWEDDECGARVEW